jgi:hypothetical protein
VQGPGIERALADGLATRSEEVARRLESGDPCGARVEADAMRNDLIAAVNGQKVPEQYLEDLTAAVNEIAEQIPACAAPAPPPAPPPPPADDDDDDDAGAGEVDDGEGKGKAKDNGKAGGGNGKAKGRGGAEDDD